MDNETLRTLTERIIPLERYVEMSFGNIFCPFHDNHNTPSARIYTDDDGVSRIFCYSEQKMYSVYDYIKLVKKQDPERIIKASVPEKELKDIITGIKNEITDTSSREDFIKECWFESQEDIGVFVDMIYGVNHAG